MMHFSFAPATYWRLPERRPTMPPGIFVRFLYGIKVCQQDARIWWVGLIAFGAEYVVWFDIAV
jgi:hypothetical protein